MLETWKALSHFFLIYQLYALRLVTLLRAIGLVKEVLVLSIRWPLILAIHKAFSFSATQGHTYAGRPS